MYSNFADPAEKYPRLNMFSDCTTYCSQVKKFSGFPFPSMDVTFRTLPGLNFSRPEKVWISDILTGEGNVAYFFTVYMIARKSSLLHLGHVAVVKQLLKFGSQLFLLLLLCLLHKGVHGFLKGTVE